MKVEMRKQQSEIKSLVGDIKKKKINRGFEEINSSRGKAQEALG